MNKLLLLALLIATCLNLFACDQNRNANETVRRETPEPITASAASIESIESIELSNAEIKNAISVVSKTEAVQTLDDAAWAGAYLDVINNLISQYGEGTVGTASFSDDIFMFGVGMVRLIDFDGDGTYELYCAYAKDEGFWVDSQVVYGYDNGLVTLLEECGVSSPGTDVCPSTMFLSKGGKVYLIVEYGISDVTYYTLQDGKFVSVFNYYFDWDYEENPNNTVNGEAVSVEELKAAIDVMNAGGTREYYSFIYNIDPDAIMKTQATIAEIAAHVTQ